MIPWRREIDRSRQAGKAVAAAVIADFSISPAGPASGTVFVWMPRAGS